MTTRDKAVNTAVKLVNNHCIYLWSAQGQKVKNLSTGDIYRMETNEANAKAVLERINMQESIGWNTAKTKAFDCSGAMCYILVKVGREPAGFDATADQLAKRYPSRLEPVRGCLVHRPGHIGMYIGDGYLMEAKGRKYGVVISPFIAKEWDSVYPDPFKE